MDLYTQEDYPVYNGMMAESKDMKTPLYLLYMQQM